ncbi:MAG: urea transporter [Amphritea sp.]
MSWISLWGTRFTRGFGQIMLQENSLTGLFFLAGIAFNSLTMLAGALAGSTISMLSACLLRVDNEDLDRGFYSFNGALVGLCVFFYLPVSLTSWALLILAAALSSVLMKLMLRTKAIAPYTAPFVLSGWLTLIAAYLLSSEENLLVESAVALDYPATIAYSTFQGIVQGLGQVMFQGNTLSGLLFFIGLAVSSRQVAFWALGGSALSLMLAVALGYPADLVLSGLFSFNAVLAAIAISGQFQNNVALSCCGIFASVIITRGFQELGIAPLTAPFVLATWLVIYIARLSKRWSAQ